MQLVVRSPRPSTGVFVEKLLAGDPGKALESAAELLATNQDSPAVLRSIARLHEELGSSEAAAPYWSKLYSLTSRDLEAIYHQAAARIAAGAGRSQAVEEVCGAQAPSLSPLLEKLLAADIRRVVEPTPRHIAIAGVSFSGSTLMDRILGGLPGVRSIGESHWLTNAMNQRAAQPIDFTQPAAFASRDVLHCTVCGTDCKALTYEFRAGLAADRTNWYFRIARQLGTRVLVSADKNPPKLVENDPLLRMDLLVLFKSPEQAWASHLAKLPKGKDKSFYLHELDRYMQQWARSYSTFLHTMRPQGKKVFVSFDDFVTMPQKALMKICRAFDLQFDPKVLAHTTPGHAIGGNGRAMDRLRQSQYAVEILPLPAPDITAEQRRIIADNHRMQEVYRELQGQFGQFLRGDAEEALASRRRPILMIRAFQKELQSRFRRFFRGGEHANASRSWPALVGGQPGSAAGTAAAELSQPAGRTADTGLQAAVRQALEVRQSEPQRAAALLQTAVEKFPDSVMAYAHLGRVLTQIGDYAAAQGAWEKAERLQPNDLEVLHNLARIHLVLENWGRAAAYANRVLAIDPDNERARQQVRRASGKLRLGLGGAIAEAAQEGVARRPVPHASAGGAAGARRGKAARERQRKSVEPKLAIVAEAGDWLAAAEAASKRGDAEAVVAMALQAARASGGEPRAISRLSSFLSRHDLKPHAVEIWRAAWQNAAEDLVSANNLLRALESAGDEAGVLEHLAAVLESIKSFDMLDAGQIDIVASMLRRTGSHIDPVRGGEYLDKLEALVIARSPPCAFLHWTLAELDARRGRRADALAHLDEALAFPAPPTNGAVNIRAQRAALLAEYYMFGEALAEIDQMGGFVIAPGGFYERRLAPVLAVSKLCPAAPKPMRYPECLVDVILEEAVRDRIPYSPRPRHVAIISGSLAQGGDEKQMVTAAAKLSRDPRIEKLTIAVRSVHLRPGDDFFQRALADLPIDLQIYGAEWQRRSDLNAALPELAGRSRLLAAIDLLPYNSREDFVRVSRAILDGGFAVAHVWQDIPVAALAAAVVGVPVHFVHRGSLSPDYWAQNEKQTETHFRPMRHIYRRLLEDERFFILNNSEAGCRTERIWLDWNRPDQFRVLPNIIDFASIGEARGKNLDLRRSLGIPDLSPVVGGAFRISQVKRPQVWIAAALLISETIPETHFLIIGDGELTDVLRSTADQFGLKSRLHMPGRVTNVGDWYRTMDVSLLTSEREGIPNALIEAQYFGVPVVASDVGGVCEALEPGVTGFLVADKSPQAYADKIVEVLRDEQWRAGAAARAPEFVREKFGFAAVIDKLVGHYGLASEARTEGN